MIDINCDLGEGLDNEHIIMPLISSCNISCGAHAGSIEIMDKVIQLAVKHKVKIGAHPSFPDRKNFGRKVLDISDSDLQKSLEDQLTILKDRALLQNATIHHVKPHGALYNLIAVNREKASIVIAAIQHVFEAVKLYVPYQSRIEEVAFQSGIEIVYEAFADRMYNEDLSLVSRTFSNALIEDKLEVLKQVQKISNKQLVTTVNFHEKKIKASTFCVHGDTKNAIEILEYLHKHL
ncbi:5-oxoprolinase subunit PxpA [Flavobacteriaceae bacterium]|nr:5-oxoprolinase subunit PxpA [Flavobacteriaceae bacterium]MDB2420080.1 5-oxoprolinase subunit PxpA [Flavobacteriaceae bacterium]